MRQRIVIEEFSPATRQVFNNLYPLYLYDLSSYVAAENGGEPNQHGIFDANPEIVNLQAQSQTHVYWFTDPILHPQLIRVKNLPAGFALLSGPEYAKGADWKLAEFFVLQNFRRRGVGHAAALEVFRSRPGDWMFEVLMHNEPALMFWHKLLPHAATEEEHGMVVFRFSSDKI